MSVLTILETLLIGPLKLIFEIIFVIANRVIGHPGLAIIVLSLIMNILVLPLYRRADAMQEEARDIEAKLHDGVAHIKKTFSGDERMMILQTYYRQNHYQPTDALNGSASLLLEVPFFMAAYQFLSHLDLLQAVSFGPIADLSAPDGLLTIGGLTVNLLPIAMTLINVISSMLYLKGFPLKTKIQLYGMAAFFLVFLYDSPSGLVFYWTLNNIFSLAKTIFNKLKNARKAGSILLSLTGLAAAFWGLFLHQPISVRRKLFLLVLVALLQLPLVLPFLKKRFCFRNTEATPNRSLFLVGSLFLTVLTGLLIPSTFIAASPQEYIDPSYFHDPLLYIANCTCLAAGTFLIWMRVFYWLSSPGGKAVFDKVVWLLCGVMLCNYMFFGTDLGVISSSLQYENGLNFTMKEILLNLLFLTGVVLLLYLALRKWSRQAVLVLLTAAIALGGMSVWNVRNIRKSVDTFTSRTFSEDDMVPHFQLSKTGKNVIVLMLDRAPGQLVPYIFNEKPELREQFAGFTFYENTISHGGFTNFGVPGLLGGYEYTPVEMNRRSAEALVEKHNEALKVMPVLFQENDFEVTVCDPIYPNYQWFADVSVFNEYPQINAYVTNGFFADNSMKEKTIEEMYEKFFCFSIMKTAPLLLQETLYCKGNYNQAVSASNSYTGQIQHHTASADGITKEFMNAYSVLCNLPAMTEISQTGTNTFLFLSNVTPHEPMLLQTPDYTPAEHVDNTAYDAEHAGRFVLDGKALNMESPWQMIHYHANTAAYLQLGTWFDYLRENGVYDNTKIILVSDHGQPLGLDTAWIAGDASDLTRDITSFNPVLMVKDFGSTEFSISDAFMTNADVPTLAADGLIPNPTNPFTGVPLTSDEKTAHEQYIIRSADFDVLVNNGNCFLPARWASVKDDMRDLHNWTFFEETTVLSEHAAP